jgi:outer membrane protein assembly factor BamA
MLLLATAVLGFACAPRDASAQATVRIGPEVRAVEFVGNTTFSSDSLARAIVTSETQCRFWLFNVFPPFCPLGFGFALRRAELREVEVERDVARLRIWYQRRGFREVQVTGETTFGDDTRAEVRFTVTEGQPVLADSIVYLGAEDFVDTDLLEDLPIRPGDRWSSLQLDATRDTLVRRLTNTGYPYADVLRQTVFPAEEPYRAGHASELRRHPGGGHRPSERVDDSEYPAVPVG